mmetsp:Transcript_4132/g.8805  ORF Transcript_4132/g.8805 Transcript_4132/m.8805 type:complete len:384 (+) Transcript_4132:69-1220(+)
MYHGTMDTPTSETMNAPRGDDDGNRPPVDECLSPLAPERKPTIETPERNDRMLKRYSRHTTEHAQLSSSFSKVIEDLNSKEQPLQNELEDEDSVAATCMPRSLSEITSTDTDTYRTQHTTDMRYFRSKRSPSADDIDLRAEHLDEDVEHRQHASRIHLSRPKRSTSLDDLDLRAEHLDEGIDHPLTMSKRYSTDTSTSAYVSSDDDGTNLPSSIADEVTVVATGGRGRVVSPGDDFDGATRADRKAELLVKIAGLDVKIDQLTNALEDLMKRRQLLKGELRELRIMSPQSAFTMKDDEESLTDEAVFTAPNSKIGFLLPPTSNSGKNATQSASMPDNKGGINWKEKQLTAEEFSLLHLWENLEGTEASNPNLPEKKQVHPHSA